MTKDEKKRMIFVLDLWIESCERFYECFEEVFYTRQDAVKELECRLDRVHFLKLTIIVFNTHSKNRMFGPILIYSIYLSHIQS